MKTTLELPDDLMREIKVKAAEENRRLKDLVADLLRRGLASPDEPAKTGHRVKLPLIRGGHPPTDPEAFSPERLHELLAEDDLRRAGL